uniref:Uncharacterized protein n=1 Tax=Myoviridae sp. ctjhW4 TaxID=2825162 RepID=A0A8S5PTV8_9CAUD|nr:MAG TPA: hypothetical protein [Myoviridae sp. ctjhW4]
MNSVLYSAFMSFKVFSIIISLISKVLYIGTGIKRLLFLSNIFYVEYNFPLLSNTKYGT